MTIEVTGDYIVGSGTVLNFTQGPAFELTYSEGPASLTNKGTVTLSDNRPGLQVVGVEGSGEFLNVRKFAVITSGAGSSAVGVSGLGQFTNTGTFSVSASRGDAVGYDADGTFDNQGSMTVAGQNATGVDFDYGGSFTNSGTLKVVGGTGYALGVGTYYGFDFFDNSGSIIVTDKSPTLLSTGVSFATLWDTAIYNSGLIEAEYAIHEYQAFSPQWSNVLVDNTGQIHGKLQFESGAGNVTINNSGEIVGDIQFYGDTYYGELGAFYDGREGTLKGTVFGGGRIDTFFGGKGGEVFNGGGGDDILNGGKGGDRLTGGDGADTFEYGSIKDVSKRADLITDFTRGDKIDLRAIDADVVLAGDQKFHLGVGGHAGDLAVSYDADRDQTTVAIYVDEGDTVDGWIVLAGNHADLAPKDFVL